MNKAEKKNMRDKLLRARKNEFQIKRSKRDKGLIELLTNSINKLEAELFT